MIPFTGRAQWADTAARRRAWLVASVLLAACELLVACDPLPPLPLEICGNHIFDPASGETCDGDQECVPRGEPNPCRMRCSAYPESRCPNGMICDQGACIARDHICGNLVVELGEECDGAPDCLPSGAPDACKLRCAAHDGGHCPIGSKCADSGACQPAPGACGNLVRDPGEDCDGPQDCLPPGGPDACKRPCGAYPGGECPIGSICGVGGACNMVAGVCGNR